LLEATPAIKKRYYQQTSKCPVDFLFKALEIGNNCDLTYKSSKNPRLHIELSLIRLCRILTEDGESSEKKKSDSEHINKKEEELPLPSKSEIIREVQVSDRIIANIEPVELKHNPVIEKPSRTFSIKEIISETDQPSVKQTENNTLVKEPEVVHLQREEITPEALDSAWKEFTEHLKGDGTRIVSMFKTIVPELENEQTVKIHLSNAAQKDTFILNYKPKLLSFLESRFLVDDLDIETIIDVSEASEVLYSDEQKLSYLINKYPILKEMKKTFNLDIT
jgi:DNA polymerase-3 subunit gamma/tau